MPGTLAHLAELGSILKNSAKEILASVLPAKPQNTPIDVCVETVKARASTFHKALVTRGVLPEPEARNERLCSLILERRL